MRGSLHVWARATPTLLRVGAAEALAYRAEFLVWMLTNTMPLVMLALWTTVAHEGPFGSYGQDTFVAYYLSALLVRTVTGTWVVWQINDEIRRGGLSLRLLRPIHPFVTYAATHVSAVPLRSAIALPIALVMLVTSARGELAGEPSLIAVFVVSLIGAWALTYFAMIVVGTLAFWVERSLSMFDLYLGISAILSGYLVPLPLLPGWLRDATDWLPFRYMLAFPVETLIGDLAPAEALRQLGVQWLFVAGLAGLAVFMWRRGVARYEAYGA